MSTFWLKEPSHFHSVEVCDHVKDKFPSPALCLLCIHLTVYWAPTCGWGVWRCLGVRVTLVSVPFHSGIIHQPRLVHHGHSLVTLVISDELIPFEMNGGSLSRLWVSEDTGRHTLFVCCPQGARVRQETQALRNWFKTCLLTRNHLILSLIIEILIRPLRDIVRLSRRWVPRS